MKILALLAAIFINQFAEAKDAEFFYDGSLRTRYENTYFQNGRLRDTTTNQEENEQGFTGRTQFGINMRKGETIKARITLQHSFMWGSDVNDPAVAPGSAYDSSTRMPQGTYDSKTYQPDGIHDSQNALLVNETWLWWKLNDSMSLRFGRGQLTLGDGKVMSSNDYQNVPYALDGAIMGWSSASSHTDFFAMKMAEYVQRGAIKKDAEMNLYGFSFNLTQLPDILSMLHVHILQINKDLLDSGNNGTADQTAYEDGLNYGRYGIAIGGGKTLDYHFSYAAHSGVIQRLGAATDIEWIGSMFDLEFGYKMKSFFNSRLFVLYHRDSGNSDSSTSKSGRYDSFLYDIHDNAGAMDLFSFGNLSFLKAGVHFDAMEDLKVMIDGYLFGRTETADVVISGPNGSQLLTGQRGSLSTDAKIGTEIDIAAEHNYENGLNMYIRYSQFIPDVYLSESGGPNTTISQFMLQGKIQF